MAPGGGERTLQRRTVGAGLGIEGRGGSFARAREAHLAAEAASAAAAREAEEAAARRELLEGQKKETEADHVRFVEEAGRGAKARGEAEASLARADEAAKAAAQALAAAAAKESDVTGRREGARRATWPARASWRRRGSAGLAAAVLGRRRGSCAGPPACAPGAW